MTTKSLIIAVMAATLSATVLATPENTSLMFPDATQAAVSPVQTTVTTSYLQGGQQ